MNTQALLFSCETYNLGASGTNFYHMYLYIQERLQRVRFLTYQAIYIRNMAPDTLNLS